MPRYLIALALLMPAPLGAHALTGPFEARFALCSAWVHGTCVVDGDTFRLRGERVRVADIDAPEINPPHCPREADLGQRAKLRLLALLNDGPFALKPWPGRDQDRYGRLLRVVTRGERSLGMQLVDEGLARPWTGRRRPWC